MSNVKQRLEMNVCVSERESERERERRRGGTKRSLSDIEPSSVCAVGHAPNYSSLIDRLKSHWPLVFVLSCYSISFTRTNTLPHLHMHQKPPASTLIHTQSPRCRCS